MRGSAESQHSLALDAPQDDSPQNEGQPPAEAPGRNEPAADFRAITEPDLRDDNRLSQLYIQAVRQGFWPNHDAAALEFFAVAEKALQDDKQGTPEKLFASLVRNPNPRYVSDECENRAMARLSSESRYDLVQAARQPGRPATRNEDDQATVFGHDAGERPFFLHSVMVQCFLPQKRLPLEQRNYESHHGRASLRIEAGAIIDPARPGTFVECPIPWGSRARLIFPYIVGYAVQHNTPVVDMGKSLRAFLRVIGMSTTGGSTHRAFTNQVHAIASCHLSLGEWRENEDPTFDPESGASLGYAQQAQQRNARIVDEIDFWMVRDERQRAMWRSEMTLSTAFFEAVKTRLVPIRISHLVRLASSPRRQDEYVWLAYRTRTIPRWRPVRIPLRALHPLFAPDIAPSNARLFKQRLGNDLRAIAKVYPGFRVSLEKDMLVLAHSKPPVPPRHSHRLLSPVD